MMAEPPQRQGTTAESRRRAVELTSTTAADTAYTMIAAFAVVALAFQRSR